MNNRTKAKSGQVPTLTPDTLGGLVFKIAGWQSVQGPFYNTFHINRLEEVRQVMKFPMPPHRKTVIDFIFITHGSMIRQKGLTRYEVPANSFFFLPAHQISFDDWMSDDIQGYYCHFDTNLLTKRWQKQNLEQEFPFLQFLGHPLIIVDNELLIQVLPLVNRLHTEYKKNRLDSIDLFRIYLLALFTELKRAIQVGESIPTDRSDTAALRLTQLYKNALSQFIYVKQQVAEYADLLHISPNHLNKCVKTATGQSARDLLDEMILLEAKLLLAQTDLSVS
jgi:AraC family transcriptional activator of pobA